MINIKRIIQEEIDSFDWMDKINTPDDELSYNHASIGMRVKLNTFYSGEENEFNPRNMEGTVVDVFDSPSVDYGGFVQNYPNIQVQWDNGRKQYYYDKEVSVVGLKESNDFDWVWDGTKFSQL